MYSTFRLLNNDLNNELLGLKFRLEIEILPELCYCSRLYKYGIGL